ncbi:hypothetical protein ACJIZ3_008734 [Penstemon smallii]|uniref:Uncharacterized protein n=1 Tax=Penstemon smallii TaxID=265156 RepID=A0ABD3TC74_9LAMI
MMISGSATCNISSLSFKIHFYVFFLFLSTYSPFRRLSMDIDFFYHLLPYSSPPSIDPQLTANSPKEQQTTAKTANQACLFAKSTRPEHVLGGPKLQIAKLNPAD